MKVVRSFLLASVAGLAASAGAEAADLPVKAKAAEYVKICSLYGVGFYYIPGTDTCIRIGGQLRAEYSFFAGGSHTQNWGSNQAFQDRAEDYWYNRQRVYLNMDVRQQTEYGLLRSYAVVKWEFATTSGNAFGQQAGNLGPVQTLGIDVGFIQWGGFLIGRVQDSYFSMPWDNASYFGVSVNLGTSDWSNGRFVTAYTSSVRQRRVGLAVGRRVEALFELRQRPVDLQWRCGSRFDARDDCRQQRCSVRLGRGRHGRGVWCTRLAEQLGRRPARA